MSSLTSVLIFDFDGTIADSIPLSFELFQELAVRYHFLQMHDFAEFQDLMSLSLPQILLKLRISPLTIRKALAENKTIGIAKICTCPPFPGITEQIQTLSQTYQLAIVSSNLADIIAEYLNHYKLEKYFSLIVGSETHKDKIRKIQVVLRKFKIKPSQAILIGDSVRDIRDAKKLNIRSIAVSYGIHSAATLGKEKSDKLISHPQDLTTAISKLENV